LKEGDEERRGSEPIYQQNNGGFSDGKMFLVGTEERGGEEGSKIKIRDRRCASGEASP